MSSSQLQPPQSTLPTAVKNRFLGFLIWQSIPSTIIFIIFRNFLLLSVLSKPYSYSHTHFLFTIVSFISFHFFQLLFSSALATISSPNPNPTILSPSQLAFSFLRLLFTDSSPDLRCRAMYSIRLVAFILAAAVAGLVQVSAVCGWCFGGYSDEEFIGRILIRGGVIGVLYGLVYVYTKRWVLEFPLIQRPPFFSFKMGITFAIKRALQWSGMGCLISMLLPSVLPPEFKGSVSMAGFLREQLVVYIVSFAVFLCWELSHNLYQILHTKRFKFAPPKGSAAAETNPTEPLLAALEESPAGSLQLYLSFLDLCMVCENNVDTWRRAAFFEETGDTYKRVVSVCLRPLEELASSLSKALEGNSGEKGYELANQLQSPTDLHQDSKLSGILNNFQLYSWCARSISSLTECSIKEDRFGVAQLSGSNIAVVSTLISCLLAVEAVMGKKTTLQQPNQFMGASAIKWATISAGRREVTASKKRWGPLNSQAYAMADVLRTSIYGIVSTFHNEMITSAKKGLLEKDWITNSKVPFGNQELLQQKLRLFLDFRAS